MILVTKQDNHMSKTTEVQNNSISHEERISNLIQAGGIEKISRMLSSLYALCRCNGVWISASEFLKDKSNYGDNDTRAEAEAELERVKDAGYIIAREVLHKGFAKYFKGSYQEVSINHSYLEKMLIMNGEDEARDLADWFGEDIAMMRTDACHREEDEEEYFKKLEYSMARARGLCR